MKNYRFFLSHIFFPIIAMTVIGSDGQPKVAGEWLGLGGPHGNFRLDETKGLIENFGDKFPKRIWKRELGQGYSNIVAKSGHLYTQYRVDDQEFIIALDSQSGETLWEKSYPVSYYENMDLKYGKGPNASPLILGDRLITASISGQLRCSSLVSGELIWQVDLHGRYGRQIRKEEYGYTASPIEYNGKIIALVGGDKHAVVALDPKGGEQVWGSPPGRVSYAQPAKIRIGNQDQLVFFSPDEVIGVHLRNGQFRWRYPVKSWTENNLTPALQLDDRHLWVASQLDGGSRVLKIPMPGSDQTPEMLWESEAVRQAHWNSFVIGDYIYGSFGGNYNSFLGGLNWRTGKFAWRVRGFHLTKGIFADGKYYFLDENGQFVIARFSPSGADILDAYQMLGRVSWTAPTLVGTQIFMRDKKHILAIELSAALANQK